jgi:hypothetical protein
LLATFQQLIQYPTFMQTLLKLTFSCVFLVFTSSNSLGAITLTSFGSGTSPVFTVAEGGLTTFGTTQTAANLNIFGNDNLQLAGTFAVKDITGQSDFLTLTGSTTPTGAPSSGFTVELVDSNSFTASYIGGAWSGLTGLANGSTTLSFSTSQVGFNFADVIGIQLFTGGVGSSPINATLTGASTFSAIPEPSRLGLVGLGLAGLISRRRRPAKA